MLLSIENVKKSFGAIPVLNGVTLHVQPGEILGLLGANGAGKSTLSKIVSGLETVGDGTMQLKGRDYRPQSKFASESAGVAIVHQELNLIPSMSVAENLFFGKLPHRFGIVNKRRLLRDAKQLLERFQLDHLDPNTRIDRIGVGQQQMLEIARALTTRFDLLILDEPTACLSDHDTEILFQHLRRLREAGIGVIYISHRLREIERICDRVAILRDGKLVHSAEISDISIPQMIEQMSGPSEPHASAISDGSQAMGGGTALRVEDLTSGIVRQASFEVAAGEKLGIAGLVGSGRSELLRAIFGADVATEGAIQIGDSPLRGPFRTPAQAVNAGLAFVPEDRKGTGLLLPLDVGRNMLLNSYRRGFSWFGIVNMRRGRERVNEFIERLSIQCRSLSQTVQTLSGGNQQKIVVARWLLHTANIFLFDEPTRGIDVAAKQKIFEQIDLLAAQGKAILIVSSDQEELMQHCDRILVLSNGRVTANMRRSEWSADRIASAAFQNYVRGDGGNA